jgi:hypothetical protein
MWNRNNPINYSDPTGFVSWVLISHGDSQNRLGHVENAVQSSTNPAMGRLYSWIPNKNIGGSSANQRDLFLNPGVMQKSEEMPLTGKNGILTREAANGYTAHLMLTTPAQDRILEQTYQSASDNHENFNLADNNCAEMTRRAYINAGFPNALRYFGISPHEDEGNFQSYKP